MSKTPEILIPVARQYWHNQRGGGQVPGFDYDETCQIVSALEQRIKKLKMERTAMIAAKEAHLRQVEGLEANLTHIGCARDCNWETHDNMP